MYEMRSPHDWLKTVPELDVPTPDDIQMEIDILAGSNRFAQGFPAEDDWAIRHSVSDFAQE